MHLFFKHEAFLQKSNFAPSASFCCCSMKDIGKTNNGANEALKTGKPCKVRKSSKLCKVRITLNLSQVRFEDKKSSA